MPSKVNIKGYVTARPGAYGDGDASRLSGRVVELNRLALVGDFPELQQAVAREFSSGRAISDLNPSSDKLANIGLWTYNPFTDDAVRGGPNATVLVSARETTQAKGSFDNAAAGDCLELFSTVWGPAGNRTRVKITANSGDASLRDFTIARDGVTETHEGLGSGAVLTISYGTGGEATLVTYGVALNQLIFTNEKDDVPVGATWNPATMAWDGKVSVEPDAAPGGAETLGVTINGINKANGDALSEELNWTGTDGAKKTTSGEFSDVISVVPVLSGGATTLLTVGANAFDFEATQYDNMAQVADAINAEAEAGYTAVGLPTAQEVTLPDLDDDTGLVWNGTTMTPAALRADLWSIVDSLGASVLVTAERKDGGTGAPAATSGEIRLKGGTQSATLDYGAAFDALQKEDAQIVWLESTDVADIQRGRAHCQYMAGAGRGERNLWAGTDAQKTLQQLFDGWTSAVNSRHVSICPQEPMLSDHRNRDVWMGPEYMALLHAAGQSGTNVGVALTKKFINVRDARQHASWDADADADAVLRRGLVVVNRQRLGWQVERTITSYMTNDNPVYSETSTNESFNQCIRITREQVEVIIGDPNFDATRGRVVTIAIDSLEQQILDGVIKDFNRRSVAVDDLGDLYRIRYEFIPIEPVNFAVVAASAVRKYSAAA